MEEDMRVRTFVVAAVLIGAIGVRVGADESAPGAEGRWVGSIQVPGQALAVEIDLAKKDGDAWEGAITIPAQNVKSLPLSAISVGDDTVSFVMKGVPGDPTFKGTMTKDPRALSGQFTQGGQTFPFALTWKGPAEFEAPPKGTKIGAELEGEWHGTLDANGTMLRLIVRLANGADEATGTLVSLDQGGVEIPITRVSQEGTRLELLVTTVGGSYQGELKEGQIAGTWTQGQAALPLIFKRVAM
jgi:hypothetical protein